MNATTHMYFNTSHVNVNPTEELQGYNSFSNFNTSHVNVNQHINAILRRLCKISIHLMLMLIALYRIMLEVVEQISIHLMLMLISTLMQYYGDYVKFQYISC